jgi:short chain dehydrogenase
MKERATLFGLPNSPEAYELRDFLKRSGFPFEWVDLKTDDDARRLAGVTGLDDPRLPVCVMEKGSVLFRPTFATSLPGLTGASKGIGAGIAKALASEGAPVVVNYYASSKANAEAVVADIQAANDKAVAVGGDVSRHRMLRQSSTRL